MTVGYYIETSANVTGKQDVLIREHGAKAILLAEARELMNDPAVGVICIAHNDCFEAAAFMYDEAELEAFTLPDDTRLRSWFRMDRKKAEELSGFNRR